MVWDNFRVPNGNGWYLFALFKLSHKKTPPDFSEGVVKEFGDDLLSHTVTRAVPSAQESLTSVFGMGTGGTSPLWPPKNCVSMSKS